MENELPPKTSPQSLAEVRDELIELIEEMMVEMRADGKAVESFATHPLPVILRHAHDLADVEKAFTGYFAAVHANIRRQEMVEGADPKLSVRVEELARTIRKNFATAAEVMTLAQRYIENTQAK